ncbi:MAG TPA: c-type cytochrome [Polyangiaceae bacterium]|nr:c-type cytochrome [Polyangiaceae bacterium]
MRGAARSWLAAPLAVLACSSAEPRAARENPLKDPATIARGQALFADPALSTLESNPFSCATCHELAPGESDDAKPGSPLAGATLREGFWNGELGDLLEAVNVCFTRFMQSNVPLDAADARAVALYAYLASLEPGDAEQQPFTIVGLILDVPRGDAGAGADVFRRACAPCHGALHRGASRIGTLVPVLPDDAIRLHPGYDARSLRLIFVEKARHGSFLGYPGTMPPFSSEVLSDAAVSDLLEALGALGAD